MTDAAPRSEPAIAPAATSPADSFPRLAARTGRFTHGSPRSVTVSHDGRAVFFLRSASGTDRAGILWALDVSTGAERVLADPALLLGDAGENLPPAERARRERSRESGGGIVAYSVDKLGRTAVFALSGVLWACDVEPGSCRRIVNDRSVIDPRIDPTAQTIAYASDGALRVVSADGSGDRALVGPGSGGSDPGCAAIDTRQPDTDSRRSDADAGGSDTDAGRSGTDTDSDAGGSGTDTDSDAGGSGTDAEAPSTVVWGQAEFIAAEELGRYRGFWWAPDGRSLLVERYDNAPVATWFLADPAHPDREPVAHRYPAAGTANADVQLWHVSLDGARWQVPWDSGAFPYLAAVRWSSGGAVMQLLSRDQRRGEVRRIDVPDTGGNLGARTDTGGKLGASDTGGKLGASDTGGELAISGAPTTDPAVGTTLLAEQHDPHWLDVVPGLPAFTPARTLLTNVNSVLDRDSTSQLAVDGEPISPPGMQLRAVIDVGENDVLATVSTDPRDHQLVRIAFDGTVTALSPQQGVHGGARGGETVVMASTALDEVAASMTVSHAGSETAAIDSLAETPPWAPNLTMLRVGERNLCAAVLLPRGHVPGSRKLPVIMAPYGGPHAQRVRSSARMFLQDQYLADQGFAVIVADGRGSPGRGPAFEREIDGEFAAVSLADQVGALAGVAAQYPDDIDTTRVGITGWSYGGYLAALAVLERPDVFHAAVAGAPVTDWGLYDTAYTERYLGLPAENPESYRRNSLIGRAPQLTRPLLLIHGLVDDNVVVAHTLRLSGALLAAGRAHQVLPLTGITHMASSEDVAENLLTAQVEFLRQALS